MRCKTKHLRKMPHKCGVIQYETDDWNDRLQRGPSRREHTRHREVLPSSPLLACGEKAARQAWQGPGFLGPRHQVRWLMGQVKNDTVSRGESRGSDMYGRLRGNWTAKLEDALGRETWRLARKRNGAGHGVRTRDIQLGKLALYQLS